MKLCSSDNHYTTASKYINISTHRPLSESSYRKLPVELRSAKKGLINIKTTNQECFYGFMLNGVMSWWHINSVKTHPERIIQNDKKLASDIVREKDFSKIETKTTFALMFFVTKIGWFFQSPFQIKNLKT